jgi:hypothetical protein
MELSATTSVFIIFLQAETNADTLETNTQTDTDRIWCGCGHKSGGRRPTRWQRGGEPVSLTLGCTFAPVRLEEKAQGIRGLCSKIGIGRDHRQGPAGLGQTQPCQPH